MKREEGGGGILGKDKFLFLLAKEMAEGEKTDREGEDKDESEIELKQSALIGMELLQIVLLRLRDE